MTNYFERAIVTNAAAAILIDAVESATPQLGGRGVPCGLVGGHTMYTPNLVVSSEEEGRRDGYRGDDESATWGGATELGLASSCLEMDPDCSSLEMDPASVPVVSDRLFSALINRVSVPVPPAILVATRVITTSRFSPRPATRRRGKNDASKRPKTRRGR